MANPKGNEATLKKYEPKWNSGATRTIRVPVALANRVLDYARQLDQGEFCTKPDSLTQVIKILEELKQTPRNNFSKEKKAQLQKAIDLLRSTNE